MQEDSLAEEVRKAHAAELAQEMGRMRQAQVRFAKS